MTQIAVTNLKKSYVSYKRGEGLKEIFKSIFKREKVEVNALNEINFSIKKGELVGFIGPNGAGKSTTMKILSGVLYPTSGEADCLGFTPWKDRKRYVGKIGAVFGQKSQLIWDIPPIDAFHMNRAIYDIPKERFEENLKLMTELFEVTEHILRPTRQLSLGERMKCEFIMAMLHDPQVVLLDEPTIGLDLIAKEKIREFILEMNRRGITFILTTHDLEDIECLAERVMVINHGNLLFDGSMEKLKALYGNRKRIHISCNEPFDPSFLEGITVVEEISNMEFKLQIDLDTLSLNRFIEVVNRDYSLQDLSITEPSIDSVIKNFYQDEIPSTE